MTAAVSTDHSEVDSVVSNFGLLQMGQSVIFLDPRTPNRRKIERTTALVAYGPYNALSSPELRPQSPLSLITHFGIDFDYRGNPK